MQPMPVYNNCMAAPAGQMAALSVPSLAIQTHSALLHQLLSVSGQLVRH